VTAEVRVGRLASNPDVPWTCISKVLGACLAAQAVEERLISLDARLHDLVPTQERHPSADPTFGQLLTHTAGMPREPFPDVLAWPTAETVTFAIAETQSASQPSTACYSPVFGWDILRTILEGTYGRQYEDLVNERLLGPAGLVHTRPMMSSPSDTTHVRVTLAGLGAHWFPGPGTNHAGISALGPVSELAQLMSVLASSSAVLSKSARETLTTKLRTGVTDSFDGTDLDWGLGVVVDRRAFPRWASKEAFGHFGIAGSAVAFGDPVSGVGLCCLSDGTNADIRDLILRAALLRSVSVSNE
jgi:CubicO group peptidase (beta-lactamase class C family)